MNTPHRDLRHSAGVRWRQLLQVTCPGVEGVSLVCQVFVAVLDRRHARPFVGGVTQDPADDETPDTETIAGERGRPAAYRRVPTKPLR